MDFSKFCLYTNWKGLSLSVIIHYVTINITFNCGSEVERFRILFFDYSKKDKKCLVVASDIIIQLSVLCLFKWPVFESEYLQLFCLTVYNECLIKSYMLSTNYRQNSWQVGPTSCQDLYKIEVWQSF